MLEIFSSRPLAGSHWKYVRAPPLEAASFSNNSFNLYSSTSEVLGKITLPLPRSSITAKIVSPNLSGVVSTNFVPTRSHCSLNIVITCSRDKSLYIVS